MNHVSTSNRANNVWHPGTDLKALQGARAPWLRNTGLDGGVFCASWLCMPSGSNSI